MLDTLNIYHLKKFLISIKKEALKSFCFSFLDEDEAQDFDFDIVSLDEIRWLISCYFEWNNNALCIKKINIEKSIRDTYKYIVYKQLNKQVDEGKLELCWDRRKKEFFWRQNLNEELNGKH
jgi:hypothetical protein